MNTAILFLIFKRPEITKQVLANIRLAKPARFYIAADGQRADLADEAEKVAKTREIVLNGIDWPCEIKTLFHETNLGCRMAVSSAIDWFFEQEEEGIILEDDCLPNESFFRFCQDLLEYYRNDNRIMAISGNNFQEEKSRTKYSYYFSRYPHCWGWATWKRAWKYFDNKLSFWPEIKEEKSLNYLFDGDKKYLSHWISILDDFYAGNIDTWDYPWFYSCWIQSGLTILPDVNLVSNIGFNDDATHTKNKNHKDAFLKAYEIQFPLLHPPYIQRNVTADDFFDKSLVTIQNRKIEISKYFKVFFDHFWKRR